MSQKDEKEKFDQHFFNLTPIVATIFVHRTSLGPKSRLIYKVTKPKQINIQISQFNLSYLQPMMTAYD
jgi:hypothetical protein